MTDLVVIVCVAFDHRAPPDPLATFKKCVCTCPFVDSVMEVTGTFDLIVQGRCKSLAEYHQHFEAIRPQIAQLVARIETNFVSFARHNRQAVAEEGFIWLPCDGGHRHVATELIDKVEAEGDYMRVHVGTWTCLIHQSMRSLWQELGVLKFVQLHRSLLVRISHIDRLVHHDRKWQACLRDGTTARIAKSHVADVLRLVRAESSPQRGGLTKNEPQEMIHETV
jgi:DNA-binding LytR/AlgR family response regulator